MSNISAFIAQGQHTQGINPMGLHLGVERMNRSRNQNAESVQNQQITQRNIDEFDAGAGSREDARVRQSIIAGAQGAMPYIQSGDDEGLKNYFRGRIATLEARGSDASHSIEGLTMVESGDPAQIEQAKQTIFSIATQGQRGTNERTPADVLSFEFFSNLSPDDQKKMLNFKRSGKITKIGGVDHFVDQQGDAVPLSTPEGVANLQDEISAKHDIAAGTESGKQDAQTAALPGKNEQAQLNSHIERGFPAAESIPVLKRALVLLDTMETGGINQVAFEARRRFGVEGADEGELSNNLGKAVLSQLRETFGAAFTENEGRRLENIEAGFGKSTASNRRLLSQALRIVEQIAGGGIRAADKTGREFDSNELTEAMNLDLTPEDQGDEFPPDAVEFLRQNPGLKDQFIEKYGKLPEGF